MWIKPTNEYLTLTSLDNPPRTFTHHNQTINLGSMVALDRAQGTYLSTVLYGIKFSTNNSSFTWNYILEADRDAALALVETQLTPTVI